MRICSSRTGWLETCRTTRNADQCKLHFSFASSLHHWHETDNARLGRPPFHLCFAQSEQFPSEFHATCRSGDANFRKRLQETQTWLPALQTRSSSLLLSLANAFKSTANHFVKTAVSRINAKCNCDACVILKPMSKCKLSVVLRSTLRFFCLFQRKKNC